MADVTPIPLPARNTTARSIIKRTLAGTSLTASPYPGELSGVTVHPAMKVSANDFRLIVSGAGQLVRPGAGAMIVT